MSRLILANLRANPEATPDNVLAAVYLRNVVRETNCVTAVMTTFFVPNWRLTAWKWTGTSQPRAITSVSPLPGGACALGASLFEWRDGRLWGALCRSVMEANPAMKWRYVGSYPWYRDNCKAAVSALEWSSVMSWWEAENLARDGQWVRREMWSDRSRRIRFESGAGTARAVAVQATATAQASVVTAGDFAADEFLADDWLRVGAPDDPVLMDLHDVFIQGVSGGIVFCCGKSGTPADPSTPGDTPGDTDDPPAQPAPSYGDYVRMSRDGQQEWVPVQTFACPLE